MFIACDATIHEYPSTKDVPTKNDDVRFDLQIKLNTCIPTVFKTFTHTGEELSEKDGVMPDEAWIIAEKEGCNIRYIIDLYECNASGELQMRIDRRTICRPIESLAEDLSVGYELGRHKYKFLIWADYVASGTQKNSYYITDNLQCVKMNDTHCICNTSLKDAYTAVKEVDLCDLPDLQDNMAASVELKRPFAKFDVIASDMEEALVRTDNDLDYNTELVYKLWLPVAYNVAEQKPVEFSQEFLSRASTRIYNGKSLLLAGDYVFVDEERDDANVIVSVTLKNKDNLFLKTIPDITIPLKKNQRTVVKGEFLTHDFGEDGGFEIDDRFDDEIIIHIPNK